MQKSLNRRNGPVAAGLRGTDAKPRPREVLRAAIEGMEPRRLMTTNVIVTSTDDNINNADATGAIVTLRQAINATNATGGGTITFDPAVFGGGRQTITLNPEYGELTIKRNADVSVDASAARGVTISGGDAVRVFNTNAELSLKYLTVAHGYVETDDYIGKGGGGVSADFYGSIVADRCAFENNVSDLGAALYSNLERTYGGNGWGGITVTNSTFTGNVARDEAVIINTGDGGLTLDNVSMYGNDGGSWLLYNKSYWEPMVLKNSTITGNAVKYTTIFTPTTRSELIHNTITSPTVGIIYYRNRLRLDNNILRTDGPALVTSPEAPGTLVGSHNVIPDGTDGLPDTIKADPVLGALGNYGGLVPTLPLLPGSPAIDGGAVVSGVSKDARGVLRNLGTAPDVGAFESHGFTLTPGTGSGQTAWVGKAYASPLRVSVASAYGEPVAGGQVTFTGPAAGASIRPATATIDANGVAGANVIANAAPGGYSVLASTLGTSGSAEFGLTNVAVAFRPAAFTYTGSAQTVDYQLSTDGVSPAVSYTTADGVPVAGLPTDASAYRLTLTLNGQTQTTDFAIAKATAVIAVQASDADFDGTAYHDATATVTGVGGRPLDASAVTYAYYAAGDAALAHPLDAAPVRQGDYLVVATFAGNGNYAAAVSGAAAFTVARARPTLAVTAADADFSGSAYVGVAATLTGLRHAPLDTAGVTYTYYAAAGGTLAAALAGAPTHAGQYAVVAHYAGGGDYASAASVPAFFAVRRIAPTVDVAIAGGTYNGNAFAAAGTAVGLDGTVGGTTLAYFTADGHALAGAPSDAGTYRVVARFAGTGDYAAADSAAAAFTIAKALLVATAADVTVTYGQAIPTPGTTLTGLISGDGITAGATVAGNGMAGVYAITPTLNDPNGKLANYAVTLVPGTLTIKAAATSLALTSSTNGVSATGQSVSFTAKVASAAGTPNGAVQFFSNGVSLGTAGVVNGSATLTTAGLAVGGNAITATYVPADANYTASTATLTQTVNTPAPTGSLLLLLDANERGALTVSGGAKVTVNGSLVVDSTNSAAVVVTGGGSVKASEVDIVGGQVLTGVGKITTSDSGHQAMSDPLAGLAAPTTTGLVVRSTSALAIGGATAVTLQPGVYVGGIHITGAAKVTLAPGVYYLKGGGLSVTGSAGLTGAGVLIYNAPAAGGDTLNFSGAATVRLSPMTVGVWAGLTLFQSRTSTNDIYVSGSASLKITGSIYAASATLNISGTGFVSTGGGNMILDDLIVTGGGVLIV